MAGTISIAVYSDDPPAEFVKRTLAVADTVGVNIESDRLGDDEVGGDPYADVTGEYGDSSIRFQFNLGDDRPLDEPALSLGGFVDTVHPKWAQPDTNYAEWMDVVFELVCRLAAQLEADYIAWLNTARDPMQSVPQGRPISETIESAPALGVYSATVLDQLRGTDSFFETDPWYVADIDGDRTLRIESEEPWTEGEWRPPTEAPYFTDASFQASGTSKTKHRGLSDPFASFDPGEIGTDVCVHRDDIAPEFANEDLHLIPVRVDKHRNLRHIETDAFVRNVVTDPTGDKADSIKRMLSDIPAAAGEDLYVSALLQDVIPPSFVRLDDPDDENVVTKMMRLDTDVNKIKLLVSLGRVAQQDDFTTEDLDSMEGALDTLNELDDNENIDQYIQQKLL